MRILHDNDEVVLAQAEAHKKRIPILYGILVINTTLVAVTHHGAGNNVFVTLVFPVLLDAVLLVRLVQWHRLKKTKFTLEEARRTIDSATLVGGILACMLLAWAVAMMQMDVAPDANGKLSGDSHVVIYIGMTAISCISLMMHVRAAALLITIVVVPPFCQLLLNTGSTMEVAIAINLLLVSAGMVYVMFFFADDFAETVRSRAVLRSLNETNANLANTDAVTGLPNRRQLFTAMRDVKEQKSGFAILLLDLDGFKQVNDVYGHLVGDQLLVEIGQRLLAMAPASRCIARTGGDEFAILLIGPHSDEGVLALASDLIASIRNPVIMPNVIATVGASIGISIAASDADVTDVDHYKCADYALFHAKKLGRSRAEIFNPNHQQSILRESAIEQALGCADLNREIDVVYQPTLGVVPGFCIILLLTASTMEVAIAINLLIVSASMVYVLMIFADDFTETVLAKTHLRALNENNAKLANTDVVTKLPNRRRLFSVIEEAKRDGAGFAIFVLDLDGFKQVNDVYGHHVGDQLLIEAGQRLVATVPASACVARTGGDEFAILVRGRQSEEEMLALANQIIANVRKPVVLPNALASVGASIGISIADPATPTRVDCDHYKWADYALYHAKRRGRSRAEIFSPGHEASILRDSAIEQALLRADFERELTVMYQPIVDTCTGEVTAYEALCRWTSPEHGVVSPALFIPIAERSDIIHRLTQTVLLKALATATEWPEHICLKVNLSMRDLTSPEQCLRLIALLHKTSFDPGRLTFEITESALSDDITRVQSALGPIRALGCSVAIDDFGTGYSNLGYIHRLQPDTIKIDRSFVHALGEDAHALAVVRTIVELSHSIGACALAEGAETSAQVAILKELGCDEIQGFYFGKPMAADDIPGRCAVQCPLVSATG